MYNPPAFKEEDLNRQHQLIRNRPLGLLISSTPDGLQASPLPFHLVSDGSSLGRLQGHLARGNPHWKMLEGQDVLVVFQGGDAYVTPAWYRSKAQHGRVVPTWNYVMVQVHGKVRVIDDHEWLRTQITRLTHDHEAPRPEPWHVTDAPASFIDTQINGIVGLEIEIRRIEGKWKVSQNRTEADRRSVAEGFEASGDASMSGLVRSYIDRATPRDL
jgi:transcriptional regulator